MSFQEGGLSKTDRCARGLCTIGVRKNGRWRTIPVGLITVMPTSRFLIAECLVCDGQSAIAPTIFNDFTPLPRDVLLCSLRLNILSYNRSRAPLSRMRPNFSEGRNLKPFNG